MHQYIQAVQDTVPFGGVLPVVVDQLRDGVGPVVELPVDRREDPVLTWLVRFPRTAVVFVEVPAVARPMVPIWICASSIAPVMTPRFARICP